MLLIENFKEITNEGSYYIVTLPFSEECPLLKINFDVDSETIEVEGNQYTVNDCLVSDNGEWINLICDRISSKRDKERQRIGARIAELRKQAGLTQVELAALTGLQQGYISRLEKGKYGVTIDVMSAIASAIGMTVDFVKKEDE